MYLFYCSNEMIITCKIWRCKVSKSTHQLSTHIATTLVEPDYLPPVDHYRLA